MFFDPPTSRIFLCLPHTRPSPCWLAQNLAAAGVCLPEPRRNHCYSTTSIFHRSSLLSLSLTVESGCLASNRCWNLAGNRLHGFLLRALPTTYRTKAALTATADASTKNCGYGFDFFEIKWTFVEFFLCQFWAELWPSISKSRNVCFGVNFGRIFSNTWFVCVDLRQLHFLCVGANWMCVPRL